MTEKGSQMLRRFTIVGLLEQRHAERVFQSRYAMFGIDLQSAAGALFGGVEILQKVIGDAVREPNVGEIERIQSQQLIAGFVEFPPIMLAQGNLRQAKVGADILRVGG